MIHNETESAIACPPENAFRKTHRNRYPDLSPGGDPDRRSPSGNFGRPSQAVSSQARVGVSLLQMPGGTTERRSRPSSSPRQPSQTASSPLLPARPEFPEMPIVDNRDSDIWLKITLEPADRASLCQHPVAQHAATPSVEAELPKQNLHVNPGHRRISHQSPHDP